MTRRKYPYQNLSLEDMDGEKWEDVPGYEEHYLISNYGRVKSLPKYIEFFIPGKHLISYYKPEKILTQGIQKRWNSISREYIYTLIVTFCINQKMKTLVVHRLVWNAFIREINYTSDKLCISHKDGEGRNNHYSNLAAGIQSEFSSKAYKRGRLIRLAKYITASSIAKGACTRSKQITQYDLEGYRIKTYSSLINAEKVTGIHHSNISLAAKGKKLQMGNFIWRYGKGRKKIDVSFYHKARQESQKAVSKVVTQYDLRGNRIRIHPSIKAAAIKVNTPASVISNAVAGKYMTAKCFIWKGGKGEKKIDVSWYWKRKDDFSKMFSKKVIQYDLKRKKLKTYLSIKDAAAAVPCNIMTISNALHGRQKSAKGYIWVFAG
jgi:hypothetical protein